ncbi:transglycosylase SLT domain-containing protein [Halovulum sp. GXIMD14793]
MRRYAILFFLCLTACAGGSEGPPSDITNACAIKQQRPSWFKAMYASQRRWGVPVHVQLATLYQESSFRPDARTPRKYFMGFIPNGRVSSAFGYAQAIDGTWDWYKRDTGRRSARRDRFPDATDFMGWYMNQTKDRNGIELHDAYNQYLAYHEGHTGYARGSYNAKSWLTRTARKVDQRAQDYELQLLFCP